jgi:neutral trehalase
MIRRTIHDESLFPSPRYPALCSSSGARGAFIALATLTAEAEETRPIPQSPDILLGPLFNDVQSAKLFSDQKTFADAIPNSDPLMILADYRMQKTRPASTCATSLS